MIGAFFSLHFFVLYLWMEFPKLAEMEENIYGFEMENMGLANSLWRILGEATQETTLERAQEKKFMAKNGQHKSSDSRLILQENKCLWLKNKCLWPKMGSITLLIQD